MESPAKALKWEVERYKSTFPRLTNAKTFPFRPKERDEIAKVMKFEEILSVTTRIEDNELKRKSRWKAIHQFFNVINGEQFKHKSFDNAVYAHAHFVVDADYFAATLNKEFKFPNDMYMDKQIRALFATFDTERSNKVDWREVLLYYKILKLFRYVRDRPLELLMELYVIYSRADSLQELSETAAIHKDDLIMINADEELKKIFFCPILTDADILAMNDLLYPIFEHIKIHGNQVRRRHFKQMLSSTENRRIIDTWSRHTWDRLSSDQRLTVMDEAQLKHYNQAELIIGRYQLSQALQLYHKNTYKIIFRAWKFQTIKASGARAYAVKKMKRKQVRLFQFWYKFARKKALKRRRRILATVMGNYATKARCFARIKQCISNTQRIEKVVGTLHKKARLFKLAGTHIREFRRLHNLRLFYHRWWNKCVEMNNFEVAVDHNYRRILRFVFNPWHHYAHEKAEAERADVIVRENQQRLERMLEETEQATKMLMEIERKREEEAKEAAEKQREQEKIEKLEQSRQVLRAERAAESRILMAIQREARRKRVEADIEHIKAVFHADYEEKARDMYLRAKDRITSYIDNPENKLALELKMQQLKREFHANPTPETKEKERILSSYRNILFLYLDAKLTLENRHIMELLPDFDRGQKGYLTYGEFGNLIRSVGAQLNESQVSSVIRGVDTDKDGYVDFKEIEQSFQEINQMGVPGSPWKMYVDPAEDVIVYHNFLTGEKYFEYQMNDKIFKTIVIANLYGDAEYRTKLQLMEIRKEMWDERLKNYMIKRLHYMYRYWKAKNWRRKKIWKVEKKVLKYRSQQQKIIIKFIEKVLYSFQCRQNFKKQLHLTIEKVYDIDSVRLFYYNHHTKESSWEMPRLLRRYGDVTMPCIWMPMDPVDPEDAEDEEGGGDGSSPGDKKKHKKKKNKKKSKKTIVHDGPTRYWHIIAKREFPKKPDGFPLCSVCEHFLAIRTCKQCTEQYCFSCHRKTHGHPLGFFQNVKVKKKQYTNPHFMEQLNNFAHEWTETKPLTCDYCKSLNHLNAAFYCQNCNKNLCRQCFQRVHPHDRATDHYYWNV